MEKMFDKMDTRKSGKPDHPLAFHDDLAAVLRGIGGGADCQDQETRTAVRRHAMRASPALILLNEAYGRQLDNCRSRSRCSGVSTASMRLRASSREASISRRKAIMSS